VPNGVFVFTAIFALADNQRNAFLRRPQDESALLSPDFGSKRFVVMFFAWMIHDGSNGLRQQLLY
jgi:hypothetical protein